MSCFSQAGLAVNPASLLPGAVPRIPGAVSVIPGMAPTSLSAAARPLPATDTIPDKQASSEGGVSFDSPVQVSTLQNANKVGQTAVCMFYSFKNWLCVGLHD